MSISTYINKSILIFSGAVSWHKNAFILDYLCETPNKSTAALQRTAENIYFWAKKIRESGDVEEVCFIFFFFPSFLQFFAAWLAENGGKHFSASVIQGNVTLTNKLPKNEQLKLFQLMKEKNLTR